MSDGTTSADYILVLKWRWPLSIKEKAITRRQKNTGRKTKSIPGQLTSIPIWRPAKLVIAMMHLKQDFPSEHAISLQSAMRRRRLC
jgi:hypothetical protein